MDYIYRIEARDSCILTIKTLLDLLKSDIKLQYSGRKEYNNPNDREGNASFSAKYQIVIEGEIIPETFWINVSRKNPLFTNESNVFASSIQHLCDGTFCHEGETYGFSSYSNDGKNTITSINAWGKPSFKLIVNHSFSDYKKHSVHGTLYVKNKVLKDYSFDVQKK